MDGPKLLLSIRVNRERIPLPVNFFQHMIDIGLNDPILKSFSELHEFVKV